MESNVKVNLSNTRSQFIFIIIKICDQSIIVQYIWIAGCLVLATMLISRRRSFKLDLRRQLKMAFEREDGVFHVVINHEEQYSIWPTFREVPAGWRAVGKTGPKAECLAYIEDVWTDMRPLSLRRHMDGDAKASGSSAPD